MPTVEPIHCEVAVNGAGKHVEVDDRAVGVVNDVNYDRGRGRILVASHHSAPGVISEGSRASSKNAHTYPV